MNEPLLLYALITAMVVFWSGNYIAGKVALRDFPPLLLCGLRIAMAGGLIAPVYWWRRRREGCREKWPRADFGVLVGLGIFGITLNQVFFVVGLSRTSVAHSSFIIGLIPIMVLVIAAAAGLERISARKAAGMGIAFAGVAVMKAFERRGSGPTWLGDALILLAGVTFAVFTVFGKKVTARHSTTTVNMVAYVGGAIALAPLTFWQAHGFAFARVSPAAWWALLYMAAFPSVTCYLIYYYALSHVPASRVSAFTYLQPVLATLMAAPLLGEPITGPIVAGGAMIFSGVYLTERG